jgi:hypothetical protein
MSVAVPSRQEAIDTLREGSARMRDLLEGLSAGELERPATIGDGDWSARDLLGHIASWEEIALDTLAEWRGEGRPWIEDVFAGGTNAVDELNGRRIEENRALPLEEVRSGADTVHLRLIEEIERTPDGEWTARAAYRTERREHLGTLLGSVLGAPKRPFGHAFAHLSDLEAFVRSLGR